MPVRPMRPCLPILPAPARAPAAAPDGPLRSDGARSGRCAAGAWLLAAAAALSGCSLPQLPMQRGAPAAWAPGPGGGEACVVENPAVGLDLLAYLRAALAERGFAVRQVPAGSPPTVCATTVFYTASWSRDASARVLGTAQLRVWRDGRRASEAIYDATRSSLLDLRRYRSPEARIDGMVGELFPPGQPVAWPAVPAAPAPAPQVVVPVTVTVPVAVPVAVPGPVAAPVPGSGSGSGSGPIFIPGPGEPPAPVPTSPVAPGGGGRTVLPY